jgi:hypothetical protein
MSLPTLTGDHCWIVPEATRFQATDEPPDRSNTFQQFDFLPVSGSAAYVVQNDTGV